MCELANDRLVTLCLQLQLLEGVIAACTPNILASKEAVGTSKA